MNSDLVFYCREASVSYGPRKNHTTAFTDARKIGEFVCALIGNKDVEHLIVVAMDVRHKAVGWTLAAKGSEAHLIVSLSAIFRFILLTGGTSFIVAHNHPSGDVSPSSEDIKFSQDLEAGGKMLGLKLVDSIIVSSESDKVYSMHESFIVGRG